MRRDWKIATPLAVLFLLFPLVCYLIQSATRYPCPIRWPQLLLASWLVLDLVRAALGLPARTLISSLLASPEKAIP